MLIRAPIKRSIKKNFCKHNNLTEHENEIKLEVASHIYVLSYSLRKIACTYVYYLFIHVYTLKCQKTKCMYQQGRTLCQINYIFCMH